MATPNTSSYIATQGSAAGKTSEAGTPGKGSGAYLANTGQSPLSGLVVAATGAVVDAGASLLVVARRRALRRTD